MRRILCSAIFLSVVALAFAQIDDTAPAVPPTENTAPETGSGDVQVSQIQIPLPTAVPPLLVHEPASSTRFYLLGQEGSMLKSQAVTQMLLTVPENKKLMQQVNGLTAGMWANIGLIAVAEIVTVIDYYKVWGGNNWVAPTAQAVSVLGIIGAIVTAVYRNAIYNNAVDNYNIHVMGLPVSAQ